MSARKTKAASVAAVPANGKSARADSDSIKSNSAKSAEDKTKDKAPGVPAGGVATFRPKADGDDAEAADTALRWVLRDISSGGVEWDESNTTPAQKDFLVRLRLDLGDRIKLGMLASQRRCTPERFLADILRGKFEECSDRLLEDARNAKFFAGALCHTASAVVNVGGAARLAFAPAVIA